ncbi:MAG TPA: hypothetical protein VE398_25815, partial [Acidobacteriota bacterium]|nr:hypothetical protein [Acidobacteriota bacterium]
GEQRTGDALRKTRQTGERVVRPRQNTFSTTGVFFCASANAHWLTDLTDLLIYQRLPRFDSSGMECAPVSA